MSESKDVDISISGKICFMFFYIPYYLQRFLSLVIFWLIIKPVMWIVFLVGTENPHEGIDLRLDLTHKKQKWAYKVVNVSFNIQKLFRGYMDGNIYEKLLNWNKDLPIIGFVTLNSDINIEVVFGPDTGRGFPGDILMINKFDFLGEFIIHSKEMIHDEVVINCLWIKGKYSGRPFSVRKNMELEELRPDAIYSPPEIFVILIDIVLVGLAAYLISLF